jgi:uncharacterized protein YkwD
MLLSMDPVPLAAEDLHRIEQQIQQNVNCERSSKHIPQLNWNEQLASEARRHAGNIATGSFFAHEDPVRGDIDRRLNASGIGWHRCAENIYAGAIGGLAEEAVTAWRLSPGHCRVMLDSMLSEAAVGIAVRQDGTIIVVQEFILK